jgi:hypothetical protein
MSTRTTLLFAALLSGMVLTAAPGHTALHFRGHALTNFGLQRGLGWSSDLGPSVNLVTTLPQFENDTTYVQTLTGSNAAGTGTVDNTLWLAPAGSWGTTQPWARLEAATTSNSQSGYGMHASFYHTLTLYFLPAPSGSAYIAVSYRLATAGPPGRATAYVNINGTLHGGSNVNSSNTLFYLVPLAGGVVTIVPQCATVSQNQGLVTASVECELYGDAIPVADVSPRPAPADLALSIAPNPARGATRLSFELPAAEAVDVRLLDLGGRVVRSLQGGALSAGSHTLMWDGRDDSGASLPAGVYWARIETRSGATSRRVVLAR